MDYVESKNNAAFNPFLAFPLERFELGKVGIEITMEYCKRAVEMCDELWIFGLSEGTMKEMSHAIKIKKPIKTIKEFDENWESEKKNFKESSVFYML